MSLLKKVMYVFLFALAFNTGSVFADGEQCSTQEGKGLAANGCPFVEWTDYAVGTNEWCNGATWHSSLAWPMIVCDVAAPTYTEYAYVLPVTYYHYYSEEHPTYYSYEFKQCVNKATSYYTVHGVDVLGNTWMTSVDWCYSRYALV